MNLEQAEKAILELSLFLVFVAGIARYLLGELYAILAMLREGSKGKKNTSSKGVERAETSKAAKPAPQ